LGGNDRGSGECEQRSKERPDEICKSAEETPQTEEREKEGLSTSPGGQGRRKKADGFISSTSSLGFLNRKEKKAGWGVKSSWIHSGKKRKREKNMEELGSYQRLCEPSKVKVPSSARFSTVAVCKKGGGRKKGIASSLMNRGSPEKDKPRRPNHNLWLAGRKGRGKKDHR